MSKEFVPYEIALTLKELGFDERCHAYYSTHHGIPTFHTYYPSGLDNESKWNDDVTITPLYQQAFRWFREKHGLFATIDGLEERLYYKITQTNEYSKEYNTYEEAELACLRKLIEIVKKNKDE